MAYAMSDAIAEEAYARHMKIMAAVLSALAGGASTAGGAALGAARSGAELAIKKAVESYYNKARPGEVDREFFAKLCRKTSGKSCHMTVANQDAAQMKDLLMQQGVMFACWPIPGDNGQVFQFLASDREKAMLAAEMMRAGTMVYGKVDPAILGAEIAPGEKIGVISGLSDGEMALFDHFAGRNGLRYAVTQDVDGHNLVMFKPEHETAARKTMLHVGWTLSGDDGARVKTQLVYHLKGREKISLALDDAEQEAYFLSRTNPERYVHIDADGYTLHDGDKVVHSISRDNVDFRRMAAADIAALSCAVALTPEQFETISPDVLQDIESIDLLPPDYNEQREMAELNSYIDLVQYKMSIDDEGNTPWGPGDKSISYSEFSGFEHLEDIDAAERERGFERYKEARFYREEDLEPVYVDREGESLDNIIADAQRRHDEKFVESMGRSRRERSSEREETK